MRVANQMVHQLISKAGAELILIFPVEDLDNQVSIRSVQSQLQR